MGVKEAVNLQAPAPLAGCPACGSRKLEGFYQATQVPVNSCILISSREEALRYPKGDIDLHYCHDCGFIHNAKLDPKLIEYSGRYEETQGYSDTFNAFHKRLAEQLIARHDLRGKKVLEIGCGKGEFLTLLCDLGDNRGTGFDPAYVAERSRAPRSARVSFVTDFYSERYAHVDADFYCCKMTLEHIPRVAQFIAMVRAAIGERTGALVFFQVPETSIILKDCRFWDIYYEHCSYFDRASLARLFSEAGFDVTKTWVDYDDQYLMLEARPSSRSAAGPSRDAAALKESERAMRHFSRTVRSRIDDWRRLVADRRAHGKRVILWGSGSKAVSFITTLGIGEEIDQVVDINPHRQGMFMPASGQRIVAPEELPARPPDTVIIMNPIYRQEIAHRIRSLGLAPEILTL